MDEYQNLDTILPIDFYLDSDGAGQQYLHTYGARPDGDTMARWYVVRGGPGSLPDDMIDYMP
jgi:hypothetical protein